MASSIGSITFLKMSGPDIPATAVMVQVIDRANNDGSVFRLSAEKVPDYTIQTIEECSTVAAANTAEDDYAALIGTLVTVTDDFGRTVNNVMVINARVTRKQTVTNSVPSGTVALVFGVWNLKPT